MDRFYGKYIGIVTDNEDPKNLCRLKVTVPEVMGEQATGWCLPNSPYAGPGVGWAAVPPLDALVLVEWPAGDVTRTPVWAGAIWSDGAGVPDAGPAAVLLVTPGGHQVQLIDEPEGDAAIVLTAASGAVLRLDGDGVQVEFGTQKIAMTDAKISFNGGALEVS
ncbi:phage baseplate assembly protein V [Actinomadura sp. 6N118]|uniref:phage baseplate assembly protein V n=1 Tax=Actinomadura sp. 6N118 TaxID=3375151 RepID=UPI0037ADCDAF